MPRCVTGMPASSGAATAVVTPGTTSNGTPAMRQRQCFLAAAAEDERVAALEPDDALALLRGANHQPVNRLLRHAVAAARLPTQKHCALVDAAQRVDVHERVVEHQVGFLERRTARTVQSSGSPGPAPTSDTRPVSEALVCSSPLQTRSP